jgi:hypothetical protein
MGGMKDLFGDTLFGPGARLTDPDTSHKAANEHQLIRRRDRAAVLHVHAAHPRGLTDFELADIMNRQQTSVGKRRGELRDMNMIIETPERRAAPSGSSAIVWQITEYGVAMARQLRSETL